MPVINFSYYNVQKRWRQKCYQLKNSEILATHVSNCNCQKYGRYMLANKTFGNASNYISRNVNKYNSPKSWKYDFPKCQQIQFPELQALIISRTTGNYIFQNVSNHMLRNTGDKYQQLGCANMEKNANNYNLPRCQQS